MMAARRRIGVMVPSTNTTCEADFQLVLPRSYTVHGQRLWLTNDALGEEGDRKSTRLNSSHTVISYAVFCLKKKKVAATSGTIGEAEEGRRPSGTCDSARFAT